MDKEKAKKHVQYNKIKYTNQQKDIATHLHVLITIQVQVYYTRQQPLRMSSLVTSFWFHSKKEPKKKNERKNALENGTTPRP